MFRGLGFTAVAVRLFLVLIATAASRAPIPNGSLTVTTKADDNGLFTPPKFLSRLSEQEFTTLTHPFFPKYGVRIKKSRFCDSTADSYTGYIDVEARHLFFYFFESRRDPATDDVIFWTNGGPGGSSSEGAFMELGPCRIVETENPVFHKQSWNSFANIFFVEQPVGVGYSYAEYGKTVSSTPEAAKDIAAFITIFFQHFDQFKGRPLHMASESYGGRYIPLFASAVYDQNMKLMAAGLTPVNLSSVLIGNGLTDALKLVISYWDISCTAASLSPPVVPIEKCVTMRKTIPRCEKWMKASCIDSFDTIDCLAAYSFCSNVMTKPFQETGLNPYNMSTSCGPVAGGAEVSCFPHTHIEEYLTKESTRTLLGVDPQANFTSINLDLNAAFFANLDHLQPGTSDYVGALLERGIRVLIYVGEYDWICNWVGNERWTLDLEWSGKEEFRSQPLTEWSVNGRVVGKTRRARNFTFATIREAGHMVPYDKPVESLEMLRRWLGGEDLQLDRYLH